VLSITSNFPPAISSQKAQREKIGSHKLGAWQMPNAVECKFFLIFKWKIKRRASAVEIVGCWMPRGNEKQCLCGAFEVRDA